LVDRVNKFSDIEHIDQLQNKFLPLIKKHSGKIDSLLNIVEDCKETVRRFDEDLCLKASKGEMIEYKNYFD